MNQSHLAVGDILMKLNYGGAVHDVIACGQRWNKAGNATDGYVHAAIYMGGGEIAESIGEGITVTRLMAQGHPYVYNVYRYADRDIAGIAAAAENIASHPAYEPGEDLWGSGGTPGIGSTYCSQFVVAAYHAAGSTGQPAQVPIRIARPCATLKTLHDVLMSEPQCEMPGQTTAR